MRGKKAKTIKPSIKEPKISMKNSRNITMILNTRGKGISRGERQKRKS
jgi:hypothetical protein